MHRDAGNLIIVVLHGVTPKEKNRHWPSETSDDANNVLPKKGEDFILTNILGGLTGPD